MPASESNTHSEARPCPPVSGVPLRDLLAANAAARLISTPPRAPETRQRPEERREAA